MKNDINKHGNKGNRDKPYDLTVIRSITADNHDFLEQLISIFIGSVADDMRSIKEKAASGDWTGVSAVAHKIKSPLSQFGIDAGVAVHLEHQAGFSVAELDSFVDQLETIINEVITDLKGEFPAGA